jgi:hypothetical protein
MKVALFINEDAKSHLIPFPDSYRNSFSNKSPESLQGFLFYNTPEGYLNDVPCSMVS